MLALRSGIVAPPQGHNVISSRLVQGRLAAAVLYVAVKEDRAQRVSMGVAALVFAKGSAGASLQDCCRIA